MNSNVSTSDSRTKKINDQIDKINKNLASTYENLLTTQQDHELLSYIIKYLEQIKDSQNLSLEHKNNIDNDIIQVKQELDKFNI
jgi:hypothetical protein